MKAYNTLLQHPFVSRVRDDARPLLLQAAADIPNVPKEYPTREAWRARNRSKHTPAAGYLGVVMSRTFNLLRMFEQMDRARYLLGRSPHALRSRAVRLDRVEWTQYHFLVFTASVPAIIDCCLLLTADTYLLGIPSRLCSFDLVTSHQWLNGSEVAKALKALRREVEKDVQRRHRYLHRGEEADFGELTAPEWLLDLKMITLEASAGDVKIDRRILAGAWRETLRELQPALDRTEGAALRGTEAVLTALVPQFDTTMRLLGPVVATQDGSGSPTMR